MRLPEQGQIAGVCAGLGVYFDLDPTLIRVIFIALAFLTGGGMVLIYLVLAIIMPTPVQASTKASQADGEESVISSRFQELAHEMNGDNGRRLRNYAGIGLILLGVWLLAVQFFPQWIDFRWEFVWPVVMILVGLVILMRKGR